jgi:hypothetical protein
LAVETYGSGVTVAELIGAGLVSEKLIVIGTCGTAFYLGACIGSLAVATGKYFSGGMEIIDLFSSAKRHNIPLSHKLHREILTAYPEICNTRLRGRSKIAFRKLEWESMGTA